MKNQNKENDYRLKWDTVKQDWPLWVFMAVFLAVGFILYPMLPDQVPSHWNIQGEVDRYSSQTFGAFFAPLLTIGLYLLMLILPILDPHRANYLRFMGAYRFLRWGLVLFMGGIYAVTSLVALGYELNVSLIVKASVAVLFIILGNFMGQFRHNYFVGIKTPWTLASEEVWQKTHRMAGKLWVVAGFLQLALAMVQATWSETLYVAIIAIMVIIPIVYSYLVFDKTQK